jgi:ATP-dependent DNA helicase RecG
MTKEQLIARIEKPEWSDFECKRSQHGVSEDAYRTVSAFANTDGGTLVFGVRDSNGQLEIVGVSEPDKVQNDFLSALRTGDKLNRRISAMEERFEHEGKTLLVFHIPEAKRSEKPVYLRGDIRQSYIRRGASDEQCLPTEIERFLRDAAAERWDSLSVDYDPERCFDHHSVAWYRNRYESRPASRSYAGASDSEFLFQLGLIRETSQGRRPTNAAILLFGSDGYLRGMLPRPIADCQRFGFTYGENPPGVRWLDRVIMESNLIQAWLSFVDWYMKFASVPFRLDPKTMERNDTPADFIAFRESFVNVLCHQDYQDHTRKPVIRHFSDRTVFWNPGDAFASGDILSPGPKEVRNPIIVESLRRIGFNENAGWGLNDVIAEWTKLGNAPPVICNGKENKDFEVTLLVGQGTDSTVRDGAQLGARSEARSEAQSDQVLMALSEAPLSAHEIAQSLEMDGKSGAFKRSLKGLLEASLIEYTIPEKPMSRLQKYRLTDAGKKTLENIQ